ncbi:family 43 glycosylhydrolase [Bifidobacterium sp. SO4]|uniref:family 43 glycosylhydrolase n=1 Tax=Bifidobacterium sp. SO4 TaxID=2809030 RepID=UPI001BDDB43C|nr:family 43 glycosylhydrolase [Bifidobacterium sp. SO4]MBT1170328.1 family 43 glycosylhydrolase [Bifidobacterium sp. SO4]
MAYYCNPLNFDYRYQFLKAVNPQGTPADHWSVYREAADPSLIEFKGLYYLFPSMTNGFLTSPDLVEWTRHPFLSTMPACDYAPDVRRIGDWMYFCASRMGENSAFYRSKDPLHEPFEKIEGTFQFWDPDMFLDDDGRLYFYWGCSNVTPIYGVELDPETMERKGEPVPLIFGNTAEHGFERTGDEHVPPKSPEQVRAEVEAMVSRMMQAPAEQRAAMGFDSEEKIRATAQAFLGTDPYIEGAWMTKVGDRYLLQYAEPGTEFNIYGDGVYESSSPLGPFTLAANNPYSYKPGGFATGAGHGSTLLDREGRYWHASTMRISRTNNMERRLGLWKAGVDADGELFCDQRYGDWPVNPETPAFAKPDWMLLSYGAAAKASSEETGKEAAHVADEDIRSWWRAASAEPGEWVEIDLGDVRDVHAVQVNFADDGIVAEPPADGPTKSDMSGLRVIDTAEHRTRWLLQGSEDGTQWSALTDRSDADTNLPHDFIVLGEGRALRYLRLTVLETPFGQPAAVSGLRVFGLASGPVPAAPADVTATREGDLDMTVSWKPSNDATGHNILWGHTPDKLYHSYMVFGSERGSQRIGALIAGQPVYVRVDAFNTAGITEGEVLQVR